MDVEGVTETNKDEVCESVGSALVASIRVCELTIFVGRRRLGVTQLRLEVAVHNTTSAIEKVESNSFLDSLQNLPSNVSINEAMIYGTKYMIHFICTSKTVSYIFL